MPARAIYSTKGQRYKGEPEKKNLLSSHWLTFLVLLYIDIERAPMTIFLIFKTITKITPHTVLFIYIAPSSHALEYK